MAKSGKGFVVEETSQGRTLVITGAWPPGARHLLERGEIEVLTVNYAKGFCEGNLDFMEDWPLRRLNVLDRSLTDLDPINRLAGSLEELSVQASPEARLELVPMVNLRSLAGEWPLVRATVGQADTLQTLITWRFDESDLVALVHLANLRRLTVKDAPRLETLEGIAALNSLSVFGVHLARKLVDISNLAESAAELEYVAFESCTQVVTVEAVRGLKGLRHLEVSDCGPIETLSPIQDMAELSAVHAWGTTRIVDGDLSPLLSLPQLCELRMMSRKEYRPSVEEVKAAIGMS